MVTIFNFTNFQGSDIITHKNKINIIMILGNNCRYLINDGCIIALFHFWLHTRPLSIPSIYTCIDQKLFIHLAADDPGLDMLLEEEPWWWWWWWVWPSLEEGMAQWESRATRWVMGGSRSPSSSWWESSIERSSGPLSKSSPSLDSWGKWSN